MSFRNLRKILLPVILLVALSLTLSACSSGSSHKETTPSDLGLTLYESPDGDWECYLPSEPEVIPEPGPAVRMVWEDMNIEQWRAHNDDGYVVVMRMVGDGTDQLIYQLNNDPKAFYADIELRGASVFLSDTYWRPLIDESQMREFEPEDRPTKTLAFQIPATFLDGQTEKTRDGYWGVACTSKDNVFYLVGVMGSNSATTRCILNSFELVPGSNFVPALPDPAPSIPDGTISWEEASSHIGETVSIYGPVVNSYYASKSNGKPTFLNIGAQYPDTTGVTAVIWKEDASAFPDDYQECYTGKNVIVTGELYLYDGEANVKLTNPGQIVVVN